MKWIKERDLLIAQTMAFVQSVTGKNVEPLDVGSDVKEPPVQPASSDAFSHAFEQAANIIEPPKTVSAKQVPTREFIARDFAPREDRSGEAFARGEFQRDMPISPDDIRSSYRAEVLNRVANFRAHQQRFSREREEYFSNTLARIHASIDHEIARTPLRK